MARKYLPSLSVMIIIVMASFMILADLRLKASILDIAEAQAQMKVMEVVNQVVTDKIVAQTDYRDIVYIHKDDKGRIEMLQANTVKLNQIMAQTINEVIRSMNKMESQTVSVPLGQVTGSIFLAGYGPRVKVNIIPAQQVSVDVENKFEQAGINQTRHLVYFKINTMIKIAVPLVNKSINVATTVPLADTIIVGVVPDTYLNLSISSQTPVPSIK